MVPKHSAPAVILSLINRTLHPSPKPHNLRIRKRHNLTSHHPTDPLLSIRPPKQIGQSSPPPSVCSSPRRPRMNRQHKRQAPPLLLLLWLRIQFRNRIREFRSSSLYRLSSEIRHVRDLVAEHLVDGFGLEDLLAGVWGGAVVEQGGDDFDVFAGLGEEACAGGVEDILLLFGSVGVEGTAEEVFAGGDVTVGVALMHVREVVFHGLWGEEGHVLDTQWRKDVGIDVLGEGLPGHSLDENACPVDSSLECVSAAWTKR